MTVILLLFIVTNWRNIKKTMQAPNRFPCEQCSYKGIHRRDLERHMNTMHNSEPYYCDSCDYETLDENIIQKHVHDAHKTLHHPRTFFSQKRLRPNQTFKDTQEHTAPQNTFSAAASTDDLPTTLPKSDTPIEQPPQYKF
jgi:hypothetical protein